MKVQNGTCSDVRVAYIGGGSHGWAWTFFKDLAREEKMSGIIDLYDIDRPMAEQNAEIGTRLFKRSDVKGNWKLWNLSVCRRYCRPRRTGEGFAYHSNVCGNCRSN